MDPSLLEETNIMVKGVAEMEATIAVIVRKENSDGNKFFTQN